MSEFEIRLRDELSERAHSVDAMEAPRPGLIAQIRRRRRARLGLAASAGTLVVMGLVASVQVLVNGERREASSVVADQTSRSEGSGAHSTMAPAPPELAGSIVANVSTNPCDSTKVGHECIGGIFSFELRSPAELTQLDTGALSGSLPSLPDKRYVAPGGGGSGQSTLMDPSGAKDPLPLGKNVHSVEVLPDGRLVMVATNEGGKQVLRTMDPNTGSSADRRLPSWLKTPTAVALGPGGAIAVLATNRGCCDPSELLVIGADEKQRRHRLSLTDRAQLMGGAPEISWGRRGLIAISGSAPEPLAVAYVEGQKAPERERAHPGWTLVVDSATGEQVTFLDGWQGLAWSPDGRGLLTARRDGPRGSELAVWWGEGMKERIGAGRTILPVLPLYWQP